MKENTAIDMRLLRRAKRATKSKSDREVIHRGLEALIRTEKKKELLALIGSGRLRLTLDDLRKMRADV